MQKSDKFLIGKGLRRLDEHARFNRGCGALHCGALHVLLFPVFLGADEEELPGQAMRRGNAQTRRKLFIGNGLRRLDDRARFDHGCGALHVLLFLLFLPRPSTSSSASRSWGN